MEPSASLSRTTIYFRNGFIYNNDCGQGPLLAEAISEPEFQNNQAVDRGS